MGEEDLDCGVEIVYVLCNLGGCVVYDRWLVGLESVFVWSVMGGKYVICYFEENVKKYWEFFDVLVWWWGWMVMCCVVW